MSVQIIEHGENIRKIKFLDKEVELHRTDPHGLWVFQWDSGEPPEVLSGKYTNVGTAIEHVSNYISKLPPRKKTAKE